MTRILSAIEQGDPFAAEHLLPLIYDESRKLARQKLAHEKAGHTLDATALVHEAYLKLIGDQQFANRGHFFAAAAEAMRRILIDNARRKETDKHGGSHRRVELADEHASPPAGEDRWLLLDDAVTRLSLQQARPRAFKKRTSGRRAFRGVAEVRFLENTTGFRPCLAGLLEAKPKLTLD